MPNIKSNVHDSFFKACLQSPGVAKALVLTYLPKSLTKHLRLETLKRVSEAFVSGGLRNSAADVLYQVKNKQTAELVYILFEHLSNRSPGRQRQIPRRVFGYTADVFNLH